MASDTSKTTATDLLRQQHDNVKLMFSQFVPSKGADRQELFDCIRAALAVHETAEEMVVYPALRGIDDHGKQLAEARIAEEDKAKEVLAKLEKLGVDADTFDTMFDRFRKSVLQHAEAEESEVFPFLESHCDHDKLTQMGSAISVAEKLAPTHAHPHGPNSAVGNLLVGPFVAIVDKVRDALSKSSAPERKAG
jgi:hemerythrin superfamily protein